MGKIAVEGTAVLHTVCELSTDTSSRFCANVSAIILVSDI
jgi:hypothetical protein